MQTAILIDDNNSKTIKSMEALGGVSEISEIIVASTIAIPQNAPASMWCQASSLSAAFGLAATRAASKNVMVMFSSRMPSLTELQQAAANGSFTIVSAELNSSAADFQTPSAETIVQTIQRFESWPVAALACSRKALEAATSDASLSSEEMIALAIMNELALDQRASLIASNIEAPSMAPMSNQARAKLLSVALNEFNIEELFTNLAWGIHSKESGALAYHSMSALFIRFGDIESANECLALSERLEESPRYFALKGLIAERRGEALGAVAHLVSSLHCYESRKQNDGVHYLTFNPENPEEMNSELVEGLNALHQQDNNRAYEKFFSAVKNFDGFYREMGIGKGK